jgi:hypothetical protein
LDTADHKPTKRHRYVDSTFEVWPHGPAWLQQFFFCHLNSLRPTLDVKHTSWACIFLVGPGET